MKPIALFYKFRHRKSIEHILNSSRFIFFYGTYLIDPHQFGFQNNNSTIAAVVDVMQYILDNLGESRYVVAAVNVVLKKALDTVIHQRVITNLGRMQVRGIANVKKYIWKTEE